MNIKTLFVALAILGLAVIALISFGAWACNSPAVRLGDLNRIEGGMTKTQVQDILGKPDEETSSLNTPGSHWWYKNPLKWYSLRIDFAEDGKLIRFIHDD